MKTTYVEKLPATFECEGLTLHLRIKKVDNKFSPWRIRYITPRDRSEVKDFDPEEMYYFEWKHNHHFYVTKLRSQGETLEQASKEMIKELVKLQKGERKLSIK